MNIAKNEMDYLCIILKNGEIEKVHPDDARAVKDAVVNEMNLLGLFFDGMYVQAMSESIAVDDETETCPTCAARAPVRELLTKGCTKCGWVSTRARKLVA